MKCRRFVILLSLFFYFCLSVRAQDISFSHIDWTKLDNSLGQLDLNFQQLQIDNQNLQKYSKEMEKYSANQALRLAESEARLQSLEKATSRCKILLIVVTAVAIGEGLTIYLMSR